MNRTILAPLVLSAVTLAATLPAFAGRLEGTTTRARYDDGQYVNQATAHNRLAYGWKGEVMNWKTYITFDLDAEDEGRNRLAGAGRITLTVDVANPPADDEYRLVFAGISDWMLRPNGSGSPWNGAWEMMGDIDPTSEGEQTWMKPLSVEDGVLTFDVSWLASLPVEPKNNMAVFRIESTADTPSASSGPRFSNSETAIRPVLTWE